MATNYQIILDKTIENDIKNDSRKRLLLHACCAPCSSYCIEYLACIYNIDIYFYNPNITDKDEYDKRVKELERFVDEFNKEHEGGVNSQINRTYNKVNIVLGNYEPQEFYNIAKGLESAPEGGDRCYKCYELRLQATANVAAKEKYDYFTTTLSISPYKRANWLNEIGQRYSEEYKIAYLVSDFKKKNGYKRSIELSAQYGLYRQDYCGCIYSKVEMEKIRNDRRC